MIDESFWNLAQRSAEIAGYPIKPEWIYCQWVHESTNRETGEPFKSRLSIENHNLGGVTQCEPNDSPQPDGDYFYINFPDFEAYAEYFGRYLIKYRVDGIFDSSCIEDYICALKHGGYFGDSLINYVNDCKRILAEDFPEVV